MDVPDGEFGIIVRQVRSQNPFVKSFPKAIKLSKFGSSLFSMEPLGSLWA
jgi:hypothetical protein